MIGRIWAIALNTFREAARNRVLFGVTIVVLVVNFAAVFLGKSSANNDARVARDFGLAAISLAGSATAIYLGVVMLYGEIERRTVHTIVSKPIERWEFVVGKYTGMALMLTALVLLFSVTMILHLEVRGVPIDAAVIKAIVLAWFEVMVVAAIAILFSSFASTFLSGIFTTGLFVVGRLTPYMVDSLHGSDASGWQKGVLRATLQVVPDLHMYSVSGRAVDGAQVSVNGDFVSWGYVASAAGYGALWIAGLLVIASVIFTRRDFA